MRPVVGMGSPYRNTRLHLLGWKGLKGAVKEKTKYIESSLTWSKLLQVHNTVLIKFTRAVYFMTIKREKAKPC